MRVLLLALVGLTALMLAIGFAITRPAATAGLRAWDEQVSEQVAAQRTPSLDAWTSIGSYLSDTILAIAVTALVFFALRLWLGRWIESWIVVVAITGELLYFLVLTAVVGRERPDVEHLDAAPPTSSFPSGHTGAAVALYGCLAVLLWRELSSRAVAVPVVVLLCSIPAIVALSRVYRGMHFTTDVLAGALGGLLWLLVVLAVLLPRERRKDTVDLREGSTVS